MRPPGPLRDCGEIDLASFDCGHESLNAWVRLRARQNDALAFSRVFVLCRGRELIGYYTLSAYAIDRQMVPRGLRHGAPDPIAAMLLGQLAVAKSWHGQGVGASLLQDATRRFVLATRTVAARLVVTHPVDDAAAGFYARFGWGRLNSPERPAMYLLLEHAEEAARGASAVRP